MLVLALWSHRKGRFPLFKESVCFSWTSELWIAWFILPALLAVPSGPPSTTILASSNKVNGGDDISVLCAVLGEPDIEVEFRWIFPGQKVSATPQPQPASLVFHHSETDRALSARFRTRWEPRNICLRCSGLLQNILFSKKKERGWLYFIQDAFWCVIFHCSDSGAGKGQTVLNFTLSSSRSTTGHSNPLQGSFTLHEASELWVGKGK